MDPAMSNNTYKNHRMKSLIRGLYVNVNYISRKLIGVAQFSSVQFSSLVEAGPGYGPLFPDLRITFLRRVLRTIRFCNGQMDI